MLNINAKLLKNSFQDRKVIITGGLGFIGSNLARYLCNLGAKVSIIDNLLPKCGGNFFNINDIKEKVQINICDIKNENIIANLIKDQDYLFNLAGQTSHSYSMQNPQLDLEANYQSQLSLLETCRKYNTKLKIIFASTRQVYGKAKYLPVDENHPLQPVDINGINKMAAEKCHLLYNDIYAIRCTVLRLTNVYGPAMPIKSSLQGFLGLWIRQILEEKPFQVWQGNQLRDFTFIDDVVSALALSAISEESNGKVFNLGGDKYLSLKDLADLLVKINKKGDYIMTTFPPERELIDIGSYYANYQLISSCLGWKPTISLEIGLSKTLSFYQEYLNHYL
ncbi:MAG: NAD-dependent epimerase/dehydratase family protein [Blastocatellia bacterium]